MSSRSRFPPFLPGLLFAATCVFFVFAASCVPFEKNKDGGTFGENRKKNPKNTRGKLPRARICGSGWTARRLKLRGWRKMFWTLGPWLGVGGAAASRGRKMRSFAFW